MKKKLEMLSNKKLFKKFESARVSQRELKTISGGDPNMGWSGVDILDYNCTWYEEGPGHYERICEQQAQTR
mgnify:CR=1 FL=1